MYEVCFHASATRELTRMLYYSYYVAHIIAQNKKMVQENIKLLWDAILHKYQMLLDH